MILIFFEHEMKKDGGEEVLVHAGISKLRRVRVRVTRAPIWSVRHNLPQFIKLLLTHRICVEEERVDELAKIIRQPLVSFCCRSDVRNDWCGSNET